MFRNVLRMKSLDNLNDCSLPDDGRVYDGEYSEECVQDVQAVQDASLPECEPKHDGVEAKEPRHSAAETGQRLACGCAVCGVRVGVVGDDAGQEEQSRPQQ